MHATDMCEIILLLNETGFTRNYYLTKVIYIKPKVVPVLESKLHTCCILDTTCSFEVGTLKYLYKKDSF